MDMGYSEVGLLCIIPLDQRGRSLGDKKTLNERDSKEIRQECQKASLKHEGKLEGKHKHEGKLEGKLKG